MGATDETLNDENIANDSTESTEETTETTETTTEETADETSETQNDTDGEYGISLTSLDSENDVAALSDDAAEEEDATKYLTIDVDTRRITVPTEEALFGVYTDNKVEKKIFKCPRYYNGLDLSQYEIDVNYYSAAGRLSQSKCTDVTVTEDGEYITFIWTLTKNVFDANKDTTIPFAVQATDNGVDTVFVTTKAYGHCLPTVAGTPTALVEENVQTFGEIIASLVEKEVTKQLYEGRPLTTSSDGAGNITVTV